jgi:hypothetical protein
MSFFKRLTNLLTGGSSGDRNLPFYAFSHRCQEPLAGQIDLYNELSGTDDSDAIYYCRKVLHTSGKNRCFAEVEVQLWFDKNKQIVRHEVQGGRWLTREEYETALMRFHAPVEDEEILG